jgi:sugar-specific transcriptional regulator TrmB
MSDQTDNIQKILNELGFDLEESRVYLELLEKSPQSALEISKNLNIGRTKVYRLIEILSKKGMVSVLVDEVGSKFEANHPRQLENLIQEQEIKIKSLKENSTSIFEELEILQKKAQGETKVLYYKGMEGIKQITWNSLKAKGEIRTMEIFNLEGFLDKEYSEEIRLEIIKRKMFIKQLVNIKHYPAFTKHSEVVKNFWELKYIDPAEIRIDPEVLIYNDVYVMYRYENGEIFGVEIYNEKLAEMQKQVHEFIFKNAKKMKVINDEGEAVLDIN